MAVPIAFVGDLITGAATRSQRNALVVAVVLSGSLIVTAMLYWPTTALVATLITPVLELMLNVDGKPVADQVHGVEDPHVPETAKESAVPAS